MYVVSDYKVVSTYSFLLGDRIEWEHQLNVYRWLYEQHGFKISRLEIIAILRDWMPRRASLEADYPQTPIHVHPIPMWSLETAQFYVEKRTRLHQWAEVLSDDALPICTAEERWSKPDTWAVKKEGNKRAYRVLEDEKEAQAVADKKGGMIVEYRPGQDVRCESYCRVAEWCSYAKEREAVRRLS